MKVRITKKAMGGSSQSLNPSQFMNSRTGSNPFAEPDVKVNRTLQAVPRHLATLEAEKGESVVTDMNNDGIPEHYKIGGKPHSSGGTPLNLPSNSFIFSKDKKLKIKDEEILSMFGKTGKKVAKSGVTPADLAKKYDINKYREILADKNSDKMQVKTAEQMITNYNLKLGKLALVQESVKGFPTGIPKVALPYIEKNAVNPNELVGPQSMEQPQGQQVPVQRFGGSTLQKFTGGGGYQYNLQGVPTQAPAVPVTQGNGMSMPGPYNTEGLNALYKAVMENPDIRAELIAQYKKNIAAAKPKSNTGLTQSDIDAAAKLSDDEILSNFFEAQKQVNAVNVSGFTKNDLTDPTNSWDTSRDNYTKTVTGLGFKPLDKVQTAAFQSAYIALQNLADDPKYKDKLQDFSIGQVGLGNDYGGGTGKQTISNIDGWMGNTTIGQAALYAPKTPAAVATAKAADTTATTDATPYTPLEVPKVDDSAPFWLQDVVGTAGAFGDLARIKKYNPWQAVPNVTLPNPTFYDPNRELAANAEQMNIGTQGAATFTGPQSFNSRFSAIQGQGAKNSADILARYNNLNVGVANQFATSNAQTMNIASDSRAKDATGLFDKQTIANQQFDNAKNQARQNLRSGFINAITNKWQTQALNSLYPNYHVDPATGGKLNFVPGTTGLTPTNNTNTELDNYTKYMYENPGSSLSGDQYLKLKGVTDKTNNMNDMSQEEKLKFLQQLYGHQ